jgi:hypothetical protein
MPWNFVGKLVFFFFILDILLEGNVLQIVNEVKARGKS